MSVLSFFEDYFDWLILVIVNGILLLKCYTSETIWPPVNNSVDSIKYDVLRVTFYCHETCEGYPINVKICGITSWQQLIEMVERHYSEEIMPRWCKAYLEVTYVLMGEQYRVTYSYGELANVVFPPYNPKDILEHRQCIREGVIEDQGVLYGEYGGDDITDYLREYAGPKGNFYEDNHNIMIRGLWLCEGDDDDMILITDNDCNEYEIPLYRNVYFSKLYYPKNTDINCDLPEVGPEVAPEVGQEAELEIELDVEEEVEVEEDVEEEIEDEVKEDVESETESEVGSEMQEIRWLDDSEDGVLILRDDRELDSIVIFDRKEKEL